VESDEWNCTIVDFVYEGVFEQQKKKKKKKKKLSLRQV
jgi:hypothetical protein